MAKVKPFDNSKTAEAIRLYKNGATIADLKARFHSYGNPIVARLKAAGVYKPERTVGRAAVKSSGKKVAVMQPKANGLTSKEIVDSIARGVAAAAFGNARFTPEPMTRTEMFSRIHTGVQDSMKKMRIGFHA